MSHADFTLFLALKMSYFISRRLELCTWEYLGLDGTLHVSSLSYQYHSMPPLLTWGICIDYPYHIQNYLHQTGATVGDS